MALTFPTDNNDPGIIHALEIEAELESVVVVGPECRPTIRSSEK